jgi:hypothetical protein
VQLGIDQNQKFNPTALLLENAGHAELVAAMQYGLNEMQKVHS